MSRRLATLAAASVLLALSGLTSVVLGGEARTHDGFFLRLSAGGGAGRIQLESGGDKVKLSGAAGETNLAVGGIVANNLALHGTIWGWSVSDPDLEFTISGLGSGSGSANGTLTMSAVGGGATYYFMPANVYVSGSLGVGTLQFDNKSGGPDGESDTGVALDLTLGKEWWVGNAWGLGVSGGFSYQSLPDKDVSDNWSGTSFAVRFSATLN